MRNAFFIVVLGLVVAACCPCRKAGVTSAVSDTLRDSIYINHYDTLRIVERDTMWLESIEQSHDRVMVKASLSHLENAYCTSDASVDEEGILTHSLDTRDSAMLPSRVVYCDRVVRDTVYRLRDRANVSESNNTIIKEVKKVAWYDKVLRVVSAALFIIVLWLNRKRIIQIISLWRI